MAVVEAIQTTYLEADASNIQWEDIPSTYEHLEVRASLQASHWSTAVGTPTMFLNEDVTNGNYWGRHMIRGNKSAVNTNNSTTHNQAGFIMSRVHQEGYGMVRAWISDYANPNKLTTIQIMGGIPECPDAREPYVWFGSLLWWEDPGSGNAKDVVDWISLRNPGSGFTAGSCAALYGWNSS
jgi:hypothetical protein